jgi:hypothetical protein
MYWQVYLHKGVIAADRLLILMLKRAREIARKDGKLFATPALEYFLYDRGGSFSNENKDEFLEHFGELDDNDIICAAKVWSKYDDPLLKYLSSGFINRQLFRIEIGEKAFETDRIKKLKKRLREKLKMGEEQISFLVNTGSISNHAYSNLDENIKILGKDGRVKDISKVSEILNISVLSRKIKKYYLCYPKI